MLDIFEKLCGPNSLHNVVIVTTKWDLLPKDNPIGERREAELLDDHMAMLVKLGAKHARHDDSIESVLHIVRPAMRYATTKTRIQEELVDECKELKDTEAGKRVAQDLRDKIDKMQKDWDKEQGAFQKKIEESNKEWAETLRRQREKDAEAYKGKVDKLQRDLDEVKSNKPGLVASSLQAVSPVCFLSLA
jgi:polyhydroxyalkanoate synthesis regulator phasin